MADLEISRTQDFQKLVPANTPAARILDENQERKRSPKAAKAFRRAPTRPSIEEEPPVDIEDEVRRMNELLGSAAKIRFEINDSTGEIRVGVVDRETSRVLKTIPPSELSVMARKLTGGGILVDDRT